MAGSKIFLIIFLIIVLLALIVLAAFLSGVKAAGAYYGKRIKNIEGTKNHYWNSFLMMDSWLGLYQNNLNISDYLYEKGFHNIAIYGMGEAGKRLYEELKDSRVNVLYGIDASAGEVRAKIDTVFPDDDLEIVDAVMVTVPYYFQSIERILRKKGFENIYALDDVLDSMKYS